MEITTGRYVGTIKRAEVVASESGAVMLYFDCALEYLYNGTQWVPCSPGATVRGGICLVRRDGQVQAGTVESIAKATGWTGEAGDLVGKRVQVQVAQETYRDEVQMRATRIYPANAPVGPVALDPVVAMQIKAIARKAAQQAPAAQPVPENKSTTDDMPF